MSELGADFLESWVVAINKLQRFALFDITYTAFQEQLKILSLPQWIPLKGTGTGEGAYRWTWDIWRSREQIFSCDFSPQEKEMEKQKTLYQQARLHERGAAEMVLQMISASKGDVPHICVGQCDYHRDITHGIGIINKSW